MRRSDRDERHAELDRRMIKRLLVRNARLEQALRRHLTGGLTPSEIEKHRQLLSEGVLADGSTET